MWNPHPDYVWRWFEMCNLAADKKNNKSCAVGQLSEFEENAIREVFVDGCRVIVEKWLQVIISSF